MFLLFGLLGVGVSSCKNADPVIHERYEEETRYINQYLQGFKLQNVDSIRLLILVADEGCIGCVKEVVTTLSNRENVLFVLSPIAYHRYLSSGNSSKNIIIDSTGKINRLSFHQGNVAAISFKQQQVDTIIVLEPVSTSEQIRFLKATILD